MDLLPASPQLVQALLQAAVLPEAGPNAPAWLLPLAATALRSTFPPADEALWLRACLSCMTTPEGLPLFVGAWLTRLSCCLL